MLPVVVVFHRDISLVIVGHFYSQYTMKAVEIELQNGYGFVVIRDKVKALPDCEREGLGYGILLDLLLGGRTVN